MINDQNIKKKPAEKPADIKTEEIAAAYDEAIQAYEIHYQNQRESRGSSTRGYVGQNYRYPAYADPVDSPSATSAYGVPPEVSQNAESLQLVAEALAAYRAAVPQLRMMQGAEREEYAAEWREYLQSILEMNHEVIRSLEVEVGRI